MSASKLSDLLPIQTSADKPNAYQVFGLENGESDTAKITAAMQRVYEGLKEARPTADPIVWKQAAKLAEAARKQLEDSEKRRALDANLGASCGAASSKTNSTTGAETEQDDPLASLLPSSKPLSRSTAGSPTAGANSNRAAAVLGVPPGLTQPGVNHNGNAPSASVLGTPPLGRSDASGGNVPAGNAAVEKSPIPWSPPKPKKKRRRKKSGLFLFGLFVILMLGAIIGLLQFLTKGGQIAVRPAGDSAGEGIVVAVPMPEPGRPRPAAADRDGVLGNVAASGIAASLRNSPDNIANDTLNNTAGDTPIDRDGGPGDDNPSTGSMPLVGMTNRQTPMNPEPPATTDPTPEPTPVPEMTPESVAANQAKIEAVEQLIRSANWNEMKSAADALTKLDLNADQSKRASALFDLADLATFYRGAIGRGLTTLTTGSTFDYVEGIPVIVVEVSPEALSIQFNKRTRSFTVDDMPPRLTEKITSFALSPERPDAIAGQALYRLIHPKWRLEYRDDTFELLASIDGQLEQVDTAMLQQVAKEIFSE